MSATPLIIALLVSAEPTALDRHAESLARIKSLYFRTETQVEVPGSVPRQRGWETEAWWMDGRERVIRRDYCSFSPKGFSRSVRLEGEVWMRSYSQGGMHLLRGWDPQHPRPLPLQPAIESCGGLNCYIARPVATDRRSEARQLLMLDVYKGMSLPEIAKISKLVPLTASDANTVRYEVQKCGKEELEGAVIDLDLAHGCMIRRLNLAAGYVWTVDQFADFGGIWIPRKLHVSGPMCTYTELTGCRVNEALRDEELAVEFPEGAAVDDTRTGAVHIWGKKGPAYTFASSAAFKSHQSWLVMQKWMVRGPFILACCVVALVALRSLRRRAD